MYPSLLVVHSLPGPQRDWKSEGSCEQLLTNCLPYTLPYRSPTAKRMLESVTLLKYSGTSSRVMYVRFWSQFTRLVQTRRRVLSSGTLSESSHVRPSIVPAFCHWLEKPEATGSGTSRSSSVVMSRAYVI